VIDKLDGTTFLFGSTSKSLWILNYKKSGVNSI
jgi:hypothetical protein